MPTDVNTAAEPSAAAPAAAEPINYNGWDEEGNPIVVKPPEPKQAAEPAAVDAPKVADSEPKGKTAAKPEIAPKAGDKPPRKPGEKPNAEERIAQLTAKVKELEERERSRAAEPKPPSKSDPAKAPEPEKPAEPQNYAEWRKAFKPKEWAQQYAKDNPQASYEEAMAALNDHMDEARSGFRQREQILGEQQREFNAKIADGRKRYPDMDKVIAPVANAINADQQIPLAVKAVINDSEVFPDLLYVLGTKLGERDAFFEEARTQPGKAIRRLVILEQEVKKELAKPPAAAAGTETTPAEPPKPRAPKPPAEVGGRASASEDPAIAAARANDFRSFEAEQNRRALARR